MRRTRHDALRRGLLVLAVLAFCMQASFAQAGQRDSSTIPTEKSVKSTMIDLQRTIAALLRQEATVGTVAETLGTIDGRTGVGFKVKVSDPHIADGLIGAGGDDAKAAVPDYVQLEFERDRSLLLTDVADLCRDWKSVPNTPGASPYVYGCRAKGSTAKISVTILVTLSGDIHSAQVTILRMTLQRGVWQTRG